jgi:hypothetical protein
VPGPSTSKSRRVEQCCYIEGARRCRKSGTGDPALCNAHRVLLADAARQGAKPRGARAVGDGIYNLVDRLVSGKKVTRKVAKDAFDDAREILDELKNSGWKIPDLPFPGNGANGHTNGRRRPDPEAARRAEKQRAIARARQSLGFGPQDPLSEAAIKARQRELAKKYHPDRAGGSLAKMQEINAAVDVLLESLVT